MRDSLPTPTTEFLTRVQATRRFALMCASQKHKPSGVTLAIRRRSTGDIIQALPGETLHAQVVIRAAVASDDYEAGWTVPGAIL